MKLLRRMKSYCVIVAITLNLFVVATPAYGQNPIVHAVLFYSPTCPHCHKVITQDLPPLLETYEDQLLILGIDTSTPEGSALFYAAVQHYQIPEERVGVPTLIIGEVVLFGSLEIPQRLPDIIEKGLQAGGIDWPNFPALLEVLEAQGSLAPGEEQDAASQAPLSSDEGGSRSIEETTPEVSQAQEKDTPGMTNDLEVAADRIGTLTIAERFALDTTGNTISVVVLLGMLLSLPAVGSQFRQKSASSKTWPNWAIPALIVIGLATASYMSFVEVTGSEAVCGPVGDCNTVQQSEYARLFGILPIGLLGIAGYFAITGAWLLTVLSTGSYRRISALVLWGLTLFGTLFSIYLTILEPFVIGASCAWCLTSAIIMTLLLWATTPGAVLAWREKLTTPTI